ncbi:MAG: EamA family transporter [Trueperaceae bacterium]|nr:EamA family transporter [Trueperaceae bacterium]
MKLNSVVLFIILCFSWGSTFLPLKLALADLPPFLLAALRFLLAGTVLLIWSRRKRLEPQDVWRLLLFGIVVIAGNYGPVFWGAQFLPSGLTGVLSFASVALALPLFGLLYGHEKPSRRKLSGLFIGIIGFAFLAYSVTQGSTNLGSSFSLKGILAIAAAALANGWGAMLTRPFLLKYGAKKVAGLQMLSGGLVLLGLSLWLEQPNLAVFASLTHPTTLVSYLYLVGIGSLLGFTLYQHLLAVWRISLLATYNFVSPVIALLLGFVVLHERFSPAQFFAIGLLLVATLVIVRREQGNKKLDTRKFGRSK